LFYTIFLTQGKRVNNISSSFADSFVYEYSSPLLGSVFQVRKNILFLMVVVKVFSGERYENKCILLGFNLTISPQGKGMKINVFTHGCSILSFCFMV
jgi:hypothetical protein